MVEKSPSDPRRVGTRAPIRFAVLVWVGIAAVCLSLTLSFAVSTWQARERVMAEAAVRAENLSVTLKSHTTRTFGEIDLLLRLAVEEHAGAAGRPRGAFLAGGLRDPNRVLAIRVLDPHTGTYHHWDGPETEAGAAIERAALRAHVAQTGSRAVRIGDPVRESASGRWVFGMSRRFQDAGRGIDVVALAIIDASVIRDLYERIDVGASGAVTLFNAEQVVLGRRPNGEDRIGRRLANIPIFQPPHETRPSGVYVTDSSTIDGVPRIVAFRRLPEFAMTLSVALAVDDVLAPWRAEALRGLAILPLAVTLLIAFGAYLDQESRRRGAAEAEALEKSAILGATLENMDQGIMMIDERMTVQVYNQRAIDLLGLPPDLLASRPHFFDVTRHQFATGDFKNADEAFQRWVKAGGIALSHQTYERERPNGTVLEIRTVPLADGGAVRTYTDVTARREAQRRIEHMARHDVLTGLANRTFFRERLVAALARAAEREEAVGVLCLDLDQFKAVNDTLGHSMGDTLLQAVAERIVGALRPRDVVARLGGDEFAILQTDVGQPEAASALAGRLVEILDQPFVIEGQTIAIGASIGIALAPADGLDPDHLMKSADLALYKAKGDGRGTFRFFEAAMDSEVQNRRLLERDLREALAAGQFELHYQPQLDLASDRVVGFEALVRWRHPERGMVSPASFIPIAEETGLIVPLGEWVLREACRAALAWPEDVRVSVNVSAVQFRRRNLVQVVMSALAAAGLPAHRLELEITESVLMQESEASVRVLHQLRALGVRIAMDDFGTGYSSLSYLRRFPFDKIKIDRAFVKELSGDGESAAIVRAIVGLGRSLGIATTAEGVETVEQLAIIRAEGCTEMQGYLLSAPVPAAQALGLLTRHARSAVA